MYIFGVISKAHILLYSLLKGRQIAEDKYGNRYYTAKPKGRDKKGRRWVIYKGKADPSKIPAEYHAWLHYQYDNLPESDNPNRHNWVKDREGNLTGTDNAYKYKKEQTQNYIAWNA